jgi:hypothetical protein
LISLEFSSIFVTVIDRLESSRKKTKLTKSQVLRVFLCVLLKALPFAPSLLTLHTEDNISDTCDNISDTYDLVFVFVRVCGVYFIEFILFIQKMSSTKAAWPTKS